MNEQEQSQLQIIRINEATKLCGLAKSSFYDRVKKGLLPQSVSLGGRAVGWVGSEINAVLKAIIRGDNEQQIKTLVTKLIQQRQDLA